MTDHLLPPSWNGKQSQDVNTGIWIRDAVNPVVPKAYLIKKAFVEQLPGAGAAVSVAAVRKEAESMTQ